MKLGQNGSSKIGSGQVRPGSVKVLEANGKTFVRAGRPLGLLLLFLGGFTSRHAKCISLTDLLRQLSVLPH